jgi:two-component system, OmpR family, sensor histidine kinase BaeS
MSFRWRVLSLVLLVIATATGATAWLSLRQASRQITDAATADQRLTSDIVHDLVQYGLEHAGWDGVAVTVRELSGRTGQRIVLTTQAGAVVADSDVLDGRPPRPQFASPILVDARVMLAVSASPYQGSTAKLATIRLNEYRGDVRLIACLASAGTPPSVKVNDGGRLQVDVPANASGCAANTNLEGDAEDYAAMSACVSPGESDSQLIDCLNRAYASSIALFAPPPMFVHIGVGQQVAGRLAAGPVIGTAVVVAVVAATGTVLLSRRVLRPIGALTAAASRVGAGDLSQRVPVRGRDELAGLARSFNRMADSLQRSEERQRRLVGDVAHELRTPLVNLRGYLEALRDGVMQPDPELFASLHEETLLQQRIVDDLLYLARAEAGDLVYHRELMDLGEFAASCVVAHQPSALPAGVDLSVSVDADLSVVADADRLRQVLGNLISNAVRATAAGGTVLVRVDRTVYHDEPMAAMQVADTGSGIRAEDLPRVFDRFWRADSARGRAASGSGLGLAIVRQIVGDHGGRVTVESTPGQGSVFTVVLPLPSNRSGPQ